MISQSKLKKYLHYDPDTGIFTKKIYRPGTIAGCKDDRGYILIGVDYKSYRGHRLAFLYMTGKMPEQVDHIDRDKSNNRWSNLRIATNSQNHINKEKQKNNTSGFKGVGFQKNRKHLKTPWRVRIKVNKKEIYLGHFSTPEKAALAYNEAAIKYFGEYARLNEVI